MAINSSYTNPSDAGALDLDTGDTITEAVYDAVLSNIKNLGGLGGAGGCRLGTTAAQSIASGTSAAIAWQSELYDLGGFHSTAANATLITVPTSMGGYYYVRANVDWASSSGSRKVTINRNGSAQVEISCPNDPAGGLAFSEQLVSVLPFNGGDQITVTVYQTGNGAVAINTTQTHFDIWKMIGST